LVDGEQIQTIGNDEGDVQDVIDSGLQWAAGSSSTDVPGGRSVRADQKNEQR